MAAPSGLMLLALAFAITAGVVESGPRKIVRRQTPPDTSHLSDDDLIKCFALIAEGLDCSDLLPGNGGNAITPRPEVSSGCTCVLRNRCLDPTGPSAVSPDGGLLTLVNVRTTCGDPFETCCRNIGPDQTRPPTSNPPTPQPQSCGQLKPQGVSNTLVGFQENQSQFGQFPWMAAVMTTGLAGSNGANVYVSGGSLIHPRVVMTAAHYMQDKSAQNLAVRLGEWNFKLPTEPIPHQDIRVSRIAIHPQYVANQLTYDVALLFLEMDAVLGPTVGTICLPNPFETFDGAPCYSSGWGKDVFGQQGKYQQILKSLKLPAVSQSECQAAYRTTRLGGTFNLHKSFMCAGGEPGIDTCTGDGGSPLACPRTTADSTTYVQAGIVAWGIGCGEDGIPGVYASVSQAVDWIGKELLNTSSFDIRRGESRS